MRVNDKQIAVLEPDDIRTESGDQQSIDSQSESSRDNIDLATPNLNEESSVTEGKPPSGASITSSRNKNNQKCLDIPTNLFKKRNEDVIYREDQNIEFKLKLRLVK